MSRLKNSTSVAKVILVLSITSFSSDALSYVWAILYQNNYWVLHTYHILEIMILGVFYSFFLNNKLHLYFWVIFLLAYIYNTVIISGFSQFSTLLVGIECLLFIIYGVFGYYSLFQKQEYFFLDKSPEFWFNTGIITYFSGSLFSWVMFNYLHLDGTSGFWAFHNLANILKNILFAIGLWKVRAAV